MKRISNPRELRALAMLSKGDNTITQMKKDIWAVKSQTGTGEYEVKHCGLKWTCTCPNHAEWHDDCKHIYAVKFNDRLKKQLEEDVQKDIIKEEEGVCCPECDSDSIIKRGVRHNQRGNVQVYGCKSCGYRFSLDKGFSKMKHEPKIVTLTLDLFFKGVSYRKICDHLKQFYDIEGTPPAAR